MQPYYGVVTWLRYSSVLFGLTLLYVLITRFKTASQQSRELLSTLSERVAERERELNSSFAKLEAMAYHQERINERSCILRDMHDGVGAHISSAIRQLQTGQSTNEFVLQTLKESLDYLSLSIDVMNLVPGDITALLANLRYRLSPRFESINIALARDVQELPLLQRLDAKAMRQLQFLIYEAFSNALQHSYATTITITGQSIVATDGQTPSEIHVRIADNGRGFDSNAPGRKGLTAMTARATAIAAKLHIHSQPGLTAVELGFQAPAT